MANRPRGAGSSWSTSRSGPSSFAVVKRLRATHGLKAGHAGTLDPFASGLLLVLLGQGDAPRAVPRRAGQALRDRDPPRTANDHRRRRGRGARGDRDSRRGSEIEAPARRGRAARPGGLRGQDRRRARLPAAPARRRGRDADAAVARSTSSRSVRYEPPEPRARRSHVSSGTYVRAIADALGGHCVTLRRTAVGPFSSRGCRRGRRPAAARGGARSCPSASSTAEEARWSDRPAVDRRAGGGAGRARRADGSSSPSDGSAAARSARRRSSRERRPLARRARAGRAGRRDRHLRRRPSRPPRGDRRRRARPGLRSTRRHVRPAPAQGARLRGRAPLDVRAPTRADRGGGARRRARGRVHAGAGAARARGVRRAGARADRHADVVLAGEDFRFGRRRRGDAGASPRRSGSTHGRCRSSRACPPAASASCSKSGDVAAAAASSAVPPSSRARRLRGPARRDARLPDGEPRRSTRSSSSRRTASTRAQALGHRAAVSIGVNPHYGGVERRIEAFLLDFERRPLRHAPPARALGAPAGRARVRERSRPRRADRARHRPGALGLAAGVKIFPGAGAISRHRNDDVHVDGIFLVVTVQCLACESTYSKPAGRGTVRNNPGCPQCGYVGWSESESWRYERAPRRAAPPGVCRQARSPARTDAAEIVVDVRPAPDELPLSLETVERPSRSRAPRGRPRPRGAAWAARRRAGDPGPRRGLPSAPERARSGASSRRRRRSRGRAPASSTASVGAIMLSIRIPGSSGPTTRSTSPSMLFRWRS